MGTSVDEIAAAAGISKGAVYRHFASKAELYVWVLAEENRGFHEGAERNCGKTADLPTAERVRRLWSDYVEHWHRNPDAFRIFWAVDNEAVIGDLPPAAAEKIPNYWKASLELTRNVLDEGVRRGELVPFDTWEGAHALWTLATALIDQDNVQRRRAIRGSSFRELYDYGIEVILRGMLVDASQSWLPGDPPEPRSGSKAASDSAPAPETEAEAEAKSS